MPPISVGVVAYCWVMAQSDMMSDLGWRASVVSVGLALLGSLSVMTLFSYGGQAIVGPALLPAQWLIARHAGRRVSIFFATVGAVLMAEVVWIGLLLVIGDGTSVSAGVVVAAAGVAAGWLFFWTSLRKRHR